MKGVSALHHGEPLEDSEWCGPICADFGSSRKDGGKCEAAQTSSQCSWNPYSCWAPSVPLSRATGGASQTLTVHTWPMHVTSLHSHRTARTIFLKPKRLLCPLLKALQHCRPQGKTLIGLRLFSTAAFPYLLFSFPCTLPHTPARLASLLHLELAEHFPPRGLITGFFFYLECWPPGITPHRVWPLLRRPPP